MQNLYTLSGKLPDHQHHLCMHHSQQHHTAGSFAADVPCHYCQQPLGPKPLHSHRLPDSDEPVSQALKGALRALPSLICTVPWYRCLTAWFGGGGSALAACLWWGRILLLLLSHANVHEACQLAVGRVCPLHLRQQALYSHKNISICSTVQVKFQLMLG